VSWARHHHHHRAGDRTTAGCAILISTALRIRRSHRIRRRFDDHHDRLPRVLEVQVGPTHHRRSPVPAVTLIGMRTIAFFLATGRQPHYRRGVPLDGLDGVRRRGPQLLGRTVDVPGNDFLEVMVAGGKSSDGVYSDATSVVVGLALPGMAIRGIGIAEPSTGRQSPPVPTTEASADLR